MAPPDEPTRPEAPDAGGPPAALAGRRIVDAHVHAFPPRVFEAVWRWFDKHGWSIRYRLPALDVVRHLLDRGVDRVVALHYSHVAGMARALNQFVSDLARDEPRVVPCATVLPGEEGARAILDEALGPLGCRGVKIHCHVQCIAADDPRLDDVYAAAAAHHVPVVIHAGDAPALGGYRCDPKALCTTEAIDRALARHPRTTMIIPHLGADQMEAVAALLESRPNLHLDTTMVLARYLPAAPAGVPVDDSERQRVLDRALAIVRAHPTRVLYGTDFPNVPYEWDRELRVIADAGLDETALDALLAGNADRLFDLK